MHKILRPLAYALSVSAMSTSLAHAQAWATFGSLEAAGFGEGSALIGTSATTGHEGIGLVGTIVAQTYRYRFGTTHQQDYALSPSIGLRDQEKEGALQGSIGYTFVHSDVNAIPINAPGAQSGGTNSVFLAGEGDYWGDGASTAQAIGIYAFKSEYYWARLRGAKRLERTTPFYLGAEVVGQGSSKFTPASAFNYQVGPYVEYHVSDTFHLGGSVGFRGGNNNAPSSGYAQIEFLVLSPAH